MVSYKVVAQGQYCCVVAWCISFLTAAAAFYSGTVARSEMPSSLSGYLPKVRGTATLKTTEPEAHWRFCQAPPVEVTDQQCWEEGSSPNAALSGESRWWYRFLVPYYQGRSPRPMMYFTHWLVSSRYIELGKLNETAAAAASRSRWGNLLRCCGGLRCDDDEVMTTQWWEVDEVQPNIKRHSKWGIDPKTRQFLVSLGLASCAMQHQ